MGSPTAPSDPIAALAGELGRMGRRLDGIGAELLAMRASADPASPAPATGTAPWSRSEDAPAAAPVASGSDKDPDGSASGPPGPVAAGPVPPVPGPQRDPRAPSWGSPPAGAHPAGPAAPPAGAGTIQPPFPYPPQAGPGGRYPAGQYPGTQYPGTHYPATYPGPPARPAAPRTSSALSGARLLAWTGGAVTLLGVVLLLVLASSREWFTPPARLAVGVVLAAALVGLGFRLHRRETSRAGALALVGTGFATAYLVVAAATAFYDYLAPVPALLVALLVAGAGLGLADRWRTQLLASAATAGAVVLAPVLADGWLLVALALALQIAALPVVLRRRWPVLMLVAAAGPLLYGVVVIGTERFGGTVDAVVVVAVALTVLAAALGTALPAARLLPAAPVAVLVGVAALPALIGAGVLGGWGGGALAAGSAVALAGFAYAVHRTIEAGRTIRLVAAVAASVALLDATAITLSGSTLTLVVLGEAVVSAVLAGVLRSRFAMVASMVVGSIGTLVALGRDAPLAALVRFPAFPYVADGAARIGALVTGVAVSVLVLGLAAALLAAGGRLGWIRPDAASAGLWVPIGLTGLYGAAGIVIPLALLVSPDRAGFTAGHALVTVSWTVAALVLLARGISRPALRIAGLVLVAAAVAKLVLFDLVALDGLARVGAFLGAGLVLLAAGTRYARMVAESESGPAGPPAPAPVGPVPGAPGDGGSDVRSGPGTPPRG